MQIASIGINREIRKESQKKRDSNFVRGQKAKEVGNTNGGYNLNKEE